MKHVVFETGGKQYRATEGGILYIEKLEAEAGSSVKFDKVLAVLGEDGAVFGTPYVEGASVTANVIKSGRSKKIRVFKMKRRKGYQRTQGHRQPYTKIQVDSIS